MAKIKGKTLFFTTPPCTPQKMIPEIALLDELFAEKPWNTTTQEEYCDDARETLTIYHKYGRIQTMERGLGNGFVSIGEVMNDFLAEYLPECVG